MEKVYEFEVHPPRSPDLAFIDLQSKELRCWRTFWLGWVIRLVIFSTKNIFRSTFLLFWYPSQTNNFCRDSQRRRCVLRWSQIPFSWAMSPKCSINIAFANTQVCTFAYLGGGVLSFSSNVAVISLNRRWTVPISLFNICYWLFVSFEGKTMWIIPHAF